MIMKFLALLLFSSLCVPVVAKTLTATCKDSSGWSVGYETGKAVSDLDGFKTSVFVYSWEIGSSSATVITQSSSAAGGAPSTEKAVVIEKPSFVSFLITYERGIWLHTFFPATKVVMITRHIDGRGMTIDSAAGSLFHAKCSAAIN